MIERIDVLQHHQGFYGVLDYFSLKLYEALVRQGQQCRLVDKTAEDFGIDWRDLPTAHLSFSIAPIVDKNVNKLLCDQYGVPHVTLLLDPPMQYFYLTRSPLMILGCDDRFSQYFLDQAHFKRTFFFPHAVDKDLNFEPTQERPYDVVMLGSFYEYEEEEKSWKKRYPKEVVSAMHDALDVTFSDINTSFIKAFEDALHHHVPESTEINLYQDKNFLEVCFALECYIKGKERIDMIRSITDVPVHIFGGAIKEGQWRNLKFAPNVHVHPAIPYDQSLEVMKKSKIVLNGNIKNKEGAHERIFSAPACGALLLTTDTTYIREQFTDGKDIVLFRNQELNDTVMHYLNNEPKRKQVAQLGRETVMAHHTWDHRAQTLMRELPPILNSLPVTR